ncbi:MAG: aspartate/glutamate racemase family protein [Candidatus Aminicenantales bacterium]
MRILYLIPGSLLQTEHGHQEKQRRERILASYVSPGTAVEVTDIGEGPTSIESAYEEHLAVPGAVEASVQAEKKGYQGIILGCFADPGISAVRERVRVPVVGPGECAMHTAAILGDRFSIITVLDSVVPSLEKLAKLVGMAQNLASIHTIQTPVLEVGKNPEGVAEKVLHEAQKAVREERAGALVLGCMSLGFLGISERVQEAVGVPVVNPVPVALKFAEMLIASRLTFSPKVYPFPPR